MFEAILAIIAYATAAAVEAHTMTLFTAWVINTIAVVAYSAHSMNQMREEGYTTEDRKQIVRSTIAPRTVVYGEVRISGALVFVTSTNNPINQDRNTLLHLIITLASHEVDGIGDIYFNDTKVIINDNGWVADAPYSAGAGTAISDEEFLEPATYLTIGEHTYPLEIPAGRVFSGVRIFEVIWDIEPDPPEYHSDIPQRESRPLAYVIDYNSMSLRWTIPTESPILQYSQATRLRLLYTTVDPGTVTNSYARIIKHLGSPDQEADQLLMEAHSAWTNAHRLRGIAYLYVRLVWHPEVFDGGIPNITAIVRGKKIFNPISNITEWSNNWALVMRDYLLSEFGLRCAADEIDVPSFTESFHRANDSEVIDGVSYARYAIDGVISADQEPYSILQDFIIAGLGAVIFTQGKFKIIAGSTQLPIEKVLEKKDIISSIRVTMNKSRGELMNGMKCVYNARRYNYQETEITPISYPDFLTQDLGEDLKGDLNLPYTTDVYRARYLTAVLLKRNRLGCILEVTCNLRLFNVAVWDVIRVTIPEFEWALKQFRVIKWKLNPELQGIDLILYETNESIYDYDSVMVEAELDVPQLSANLVDAPQVPVPYEPNQSPIYQRNDYQAVVQADNNNLTSYTYGPPVNTNVVANGIDSTVPVVVGSHALSAGVYQVFIGATVVGSGEATIRATDTRTNAFVDFVFDSSFSSILMPGPYRIPDNANIEWTASVNDEDTTVNIQNISVYSADTTGTP